MKGWKMLLIKMLTKSLTSFAKILWDTVRGLSFETRIHQKVLLPYTVTRGGHTEVKWYEANVRASRYHYVRDLFA